MSDNANPANGKSRLVVILGGAAALITTVAAVINGSQTIVKTAEGSQPSHIADGIWSGRFRHKGFLVLNINAIDGGKVAGSWQIACTSLTNKPFSAPLHFHPDLSTWDGQRMYLDGEEDEDTTIGPFNEVTISAVFHDDKMSAVFSTKTDSDASDPLKVQDLDIELQRGQPACVDTQQ